MTASAPAPVEFDALDAAGSAALAAASFADGWPAGARQAAMLRVQRHLEAMHALHLKLLAAERAAGTWGLAGDRDLAGFVGRQSRQGRGAGMAAVAQAVTLEAMPAVAEALVDGPVTSRHLAEITRATAASSLLAGRLATPQGQAHLVELARRLDGAEFGKALKQEAASLDPVTRQREHDEQRANRSLVITHTRGGTVFRGQLDSVAGHTFAKAIGALCPRPARDDDRSREQRQADALTTMAERTLTDRATTPGAVAPVQAIVTFTQETWAALRAAPAASGVGRRGANGAAGNPVAGSATGAAGDAPATVAGNVNHKPSKGSATDVLGRLTGVAAVTDETGRTWPASEIARALCDCALTRAVVGARGEALDIGRDSRLFKPQHWLALYAAGVRTCAVEGCGMPLAYCELHHLRWWDRDGGLTNLANCAAYCSFHHHEIHRRDIAVTRMPDGSYEHRYPDGHRYGGPPPGWPVADGSRPGPEESTGDLLGQLAG